MNWWALISVFIAACSYGILSSIVKMAYKMGYSFGQMTGLQLIVGTLFLWVFAGIFKARRMVGYLPQSKSDWIGISLMGITTAGTSILYYMSVIYLPASMAVLLLMQFSWMNLLMEWIVYRQKPSVQAILSVFVVLFGTVLASGVLTTDTVFSWAGIFSGLGAGFSFATFLLANGRFMQKTPSFYKASYMGLIATVLFVIIFPPTWIDMSLWTDPTLLGLGTVIGIFGVIVPPIMLGYGMPRVGVTAGSIVSTAELPVALIAAVLIADESITLVQWVGAAIIFAGIVGSKLNWRQFKRSKST